MNLYRLLSRRNDLKSIIKGRPLQRIARRVIYRHAFRAASWLTRLIGVSR
jgi:hypothetical protein